MKTSCQHTSQPLLDFTLEFYSFNVELSSKGDFNFKEMDKGEKSPERSKTIARIAFNSAMEACAAFEIETFNKFVAKK